MYLPDQFREERVEVLHAFIERHPLGTLAGHVARANPVWRKVADGTEVLVVFGSADAYVSPSSYPSKMTDGRVVPTWNYAVAHVYGRIRFFDDHGRLHALVSALTGRHEARQPEPWAVTDAPASAPGCASRVARRTSTSSSVNPRRIEKTGECPLFS